MSYILDALRRADAERERGEVPGLQSQQQHAALDDDAPPRRVNPLLLAVIALALALVVAIGWNLWGGREAARAPPPSQASATPSPTIAVATTNAAPVTPAAPAPIAPVAPVVPAALPAAPPPAVAAAPRPVPRRAAASAAMSASPAASPAARGGPENRVFSTAELPEDIRRELPKVAIGGASYSNDAASRMVIINGQIFHEGDKVANGLVLEKIKLKAAVLAFKGWRYQIDY